MIEKLRLVELPAAGCFGIACFWAPSPGNAEGKKPSPVLALGSFCRNGLRRSRWQWLTMLGTMLALHMQRRLPPLVEVAVGSMFAILLAVPVRQRRRVRP